MSDDEALRAVVQRVSVRAEDLSRAIVDRYREQIVDFRVNRDQLGLDDVHGFALHSLQALLSGLMDGEEMSEALLEETREMARRRVRQGASLDSLLQAGRVWGASVWEAVLDAARLEQRDEREAALRIGTRIWLHVDRVSSTAANAYLDEITDRGLMGRELLDALLVGRGETEDARRLARSLHVRLGHDHIVVLVRAEGIPVEDAEERPLAARVALDHMIEAARTHLHPTAGSLLVAIRRGVVVVLYPVVGPRDAAAVRVECEALVASLTLEVSAGISGWHHGMAGIPDAFAEAREAVEIAAGTGIRGRVVSLEDVVVDHMLRSSPHARRILEEALQPLLEYDQAHHAELVATLQAYVESGAKLTRTARRLTVHPNTVVYRLRRIRELSGRDPHDMSELLILFLALKRRELTARTSDG